MNLRFESPWALLLLIVVPLIVLWRTFGEKTSPAPSVRYGDLRLVQNLPSSLRARTLWLPFAFRLLALFLIILGLARPQSGATREVVQGEGVDIALTLDISGSMASLDFQPQNRLEAAKQVLADFIRRRAYDRLGLVVFAGSAYHQCPPTVDHDTLTRLLDEVRLATDLGLQDNTAMGIGLANAANMLKTSQARSRVVILLTDGVNNAGEIDPLTAAEAARALGIKVYTIGMGKPGQVPVPVVDSFGRRSITYQRSELDEDVLRQIAEKTGGLYYRAEDTAGLTRIYDDIDRLEKSRVEVTRYERYRELAAWLLLPALALLLAEGILRRTLWRRLP